MPGRRVTTFGCSERQYVWNSSTGIPLLRLMNVRTLTIGILPASVAEARNDFFREELERLLAAIRREDALAEQEEHLAEGDVLQRVLDHATDGVDIADEQRRAILAERHRPRVPHPQAVFR